MSARTERYVRAGIEKQFPKLLMQVRFSQELSDKNVSYKAVQGKFFNGTS